MENTINIGIDLGTTNSVISKFNNGKVEIFRNSGTWKDTLVSVVAYRKNKIIVGEKACELMEKDPGNVVGTFKRKMGTSETYHIKSLDVYKTPIELSAQVLKELKTFAPANENLDATVVTIPASFDTVQSNATKEAGYQAGFSQVVLLQEPIAASLAYANRSDDVVLEDGHWLVYDLGGGTFDVALVKIEGEEMRIVDHEGDNFLGGKDFDTAIVEKLIIPYLNSEYEFADLEKQLKSAKGKYNKQWYVFMHNAEEAKIELSRHETADIEIEIIDDAGNQIEDTIELSRSKFEEIVGDYIDATISMISRMLERNSIATSNIDFVLMVGGSTYIPLVQKRVAEKLQIPVNCEIDPTTAIAIGAAYYAGTKIRKIEKTTKKIVDKHDNELFLTVKMAYEKASKDSDVFFVAQFEGNYEGFNYKIIREDGGYDSGLKPVKAKISEELPLVANAFNLFDLRIFDEHNNEISTNAETIGIAQGKYSIVGQPLPDDICLELDESEKGSSNLKGTKLHIIFRRNSILSIKKTETRLINKTIAHGSNEQFVINVLEGSASASPEANKTIGFMTIKGKDLKRDLIKGADIELTFEISESRDLTITAYIPMLDQEFTRVFTPTKRHLPVQRLNNELQDLMKKLNKELDDFIKIEDYETAQKLQDMKSELEKLINVSNNLTDDDITDKRYQLEDKKRNIALALYDKTKDKHINKISHEYFDEKIGCHELIDSNGTDEEKQKFKELIKQEKEVLNSNQPSKIKELKVKIQNLRYTVLWKQSWYIINVFEWIKGQEQKLTDLEKGKKLLESGHQALEKQNYDWLKQINYSLLELLPAKQKKEAVLRGTGLV